MINIQSYNKIPLTVINLFFIAVMHSIFALLIAVMLFPSASGLVSLFLLSFGLLSVFDRLLVMNKQAIWEQGVNPRSVNLTTTLQIMAIFLGIFVYYFCLVTYLPKDVSLKQLSKQLEGALTTLEANRFSDVWTILRNNVTVLYVFFFLSICYRAGALLVIAWNASVWGATFGFFTKTWGALTLFELIKEQIKLAITILPHLVLEAGGYILASMSGLFLAKAISKYRLKSQELNQVLNASILLLILSTGLILLGVLFESYYVPRMITFWFV